MNHTTHPRQASRSWRRLWRRASRAAGGQSGQALVFGALTLFMLASFVVFVVDLGMVTSDRVEVQIAADECAYSAALYEANVVSSIAYLNDAMAHLYYDALVYAMETTETGVLHSLKKHGPPYPSNAVVYNDYDADPSEYSGNPETHYQRCYDRAKAEVPSIERTLNLFARWEWGMALASNELVKMEVHRTALKHGIDAVAIYPDVEFFPDNGVQFDLHILKLMEGDKHVGWRLWVDDPPFYVEARLLGPFHWLITNSDRTTYEIERLQKYVPGATPGIYRIQTPNQDITVTQISDDEVKLDMVSQKDGKTNTTHVHARHFEGINGWAVAMSDDEKDVEYKPFKDGYWISILDKESGQKSEAGVRRDPDPPGHMQQWDQGSQAWVDIPGQRDEVTVGGVTVKVQIDQRIHLAPDTWFGPPRTLHLPDITYLIPDIFQMKNVWVTLLEDSARIDAFIDIKVPGGSRRLRFTIDETVFDELTIHGLLDRDYNVPNSADCKWYANRRGTERDRLCRNCQLEGGCGTPSENETEWTYQYRLGNPYLIRENLQRFAHHAICDRDSYARHNDFDYPPWTEWYDIAQGVPRGREYYQTRKGWGKGLSLNYDSDGDGENDSVRIYANNTGSLTRDDTRDFDPYYQRVSPWNAHDLAGATTRLAVPIRLSEDFFFYGFTVGCWRDRHKGSFVPGRIFDSPSWGTFGAATARCGFLEIDGPDENGQAGEHFRFTWPFPEQVEQWVNTGYENLYEPVWTAHLWPMTDAIRDEHLHAYIPNQTGLSYLLRGLVNTHWYEPRPPEKLGEEPREREDVPRALRSMPINLDHPDVGEVIEH